MPDVATSKTVVARIRFARSRLDVAKRMPAIPGLDVARSGPYDAKPGPDVANRIGAMSGPDHSIWSGPVQAVWSWASSGPDLCLFRQCGLGQTWACSGSMVWASSGPDLCLFRPDPGQTWACSGSLVWARSGPDRPRSGPDLGQM